MTALVPRRRRPRTVVEDPYTHPQRPYDLVKEFVIALVVVAALAGTLAAVFSSPDDPAITLREWASSAPLDFERTALAELDGSSDTAQYGPPYNSANAGQALGPLHLAKFAGPRTPIDTAQAFVVGPLSRVAADPATAAAVATWRSASPAEQAGWTATWSAALDRVHAVPQGTAPVAAGPVPAMLTRLLQVARSGGLDGALTAQGSFFATDPTPSLLFLADGSMLADRAQTEHLAGDQWGMTNETGSYPGQAWLWLYTFWYQVKPFSTSDNADALVWGLMMLLTVGLLLVPYLPGVRSIPRWIPLYRVIWREHYRERR